ncbi:MULTISPECIES: PQQ-binding-like beta-propeller repeat protein [Halobacterium]|uniref:outer membrane protein assembly factor BamB family protein n=1 Tax=Halobacterium TaxID=2239 RepID=UPI00073F5BBB|nr:MULTISPECIES: PQQ-binding-like beta-propeller repeat protein [Halobacterium]MCG1002599.1 PQQ-binding-like beta-propeller repeat protein [Halobacterium noricense]
MDRRAFLRSMGLGVGASVLVGASPLNPLDARPAAESPPDTTPEPTSTTTAEPTTAAPPEHRRWTRDLYGTVRGLVTDDAGEELYVSIGSNVYRLDAGTGETDWQTESEQTIEAPVALGESTAFAMGDEGRLLSIARSSGERNWFEDVYVYRAARPHVHDGTVVVLGQRVHGFDADSGDHQWQSEQTFTTPGALRDGGILYVGSGRTFAKLDLADGSTVWQWDDRDHIDMPDGNFRLDADRGRLYATYNGMLFAVETETGEVAWRADGNFVRALAQYGDYLFAVTETDADNTKFSAIDLDGPEVAYEQIAPLDVDGWSYGHVTTSLATHNSYAVAGTDTGHLVALDAASGRLVGAVAVAEDPLARLHVHRDAAFVSGSGFLRSVDLATADLTDD